MRRVAIVGAGQAGTLAAVGLATRGYEVTLYSDRSAAEILERTKPTGTAYIFGDSVEVERRMGVDTYDHALDGDGIHLYFCPKVGTELIEMGATLDGATGRAVDVRLKSHDRMRQLEELGASVAVESVTPERLDEIAGANDLTLVSTGKADLASLFERDAERSVYDAPQRFLGMVVVKGIATDGTAFPNRLPGHTPVGFNFFGDVGEFFWVPFHAAGAGDCWNLVLEARPGKALDRYRDVSSAQEMVDAVKAIVRDFAPWDWQTMKAIEIASPSEAENLRLVAQFPPTVRRPVARTASGRPVMALGDTSFAFDPVGGQGAGCGVRQAGFTVDAIVERGDDPFDEAWMEETFEAFYDHHGGWAYRFNNVLLEPVDKTGRTVLMSAFADQNVADAFFRRFNRPRDYFPWLQEYPAAIDWLTETAGTSGKKVARRGLLKVARGQLRQKLRGRHFTYDEDVVAG
jgi:2-polyprenyl-6-methoxyphenol hydroxylase-like FAD-dependent oxidoreductase